MRLLQLFAALVLLGLPTGYGMRVIREPPPEPPKNRNHRNRCIL